MITTTFRSPPVCSSQLSSSSHLSHGSLLSASAAAVFCLGQTGHVCCLKLHHHCSSTTAAPAAANVDHHLHRTGHSLGGLPPPHVLPGWAAAAEPAESTSESAASTAASVSPTVQWRWRPWCEPCKSAADEQLCGVDGRRTAAATSAAAPTAASASNQHSTDLSADSSSLQH